MNLFNKTLYKILKPIVQEIIGSDILIKGDHRNLFLSPTAHMMNTLFNTASGIISIGDHSFAGYNVSIITGTHNYASTQKERMLDVPTTGRDITIGSGVWIGTGAIILGPCNYDIFAGIPAKKIKNINPNI